MSNPTIPVIPTAPQAPTSNETTESLETTGTEQPEGTEASTQALKEAPKAAEVKKALRKLKFKVDQKEYDEELPFELPDSPEAVEYMQRMIQLGKMGQNRAQKYSELEKDVKDFVTRLKKDPRAALTDPMIGVDVKQLARQVIEEEIANSQKSPEQLEKEQLQAEIKALKDQQKKEKEDYETREFERLKGESFEKYDMQLTRALENSTLPKSPYVVKKMADYMLLALQKGKDLSAEDVLPLVEKEVRDDIKEMFSVLPEDIIEQLVGKDKISALRKRAVAKAKPVPPTPVAASVKDAGKSKEEKKEAKKQSFKQLFGV